MLDDIKLNEVLHLESVSEIFEEKDYLLHTISLIPYPVFVKKENYTGHTPKLNTTINIFAFGLKYSLCGA